MIAGEPSDGAIEETRRFWEEYTGRPVSRESARETIRNVVAFFDVLAQWDEEDRERRGAEEASETLAQERC